MNNIQYISDSLMCSACGACAAVCPKYAVSYKITSTGRMYASVQSNCVNCGLCAKVCPTVNDTDHLFGKYNEGHVDAVYVGRTTNSMYYTNAQSGGVCITLIDYLLSCGKIDAALLVRMSYGQTPKVEAQVVDSVKALSQYQKSCYTPVPLLAALTRCKEKKSLAVVGLPCQMHAIVTMQEMKKFTNIKYKIGLICEGVLGMTAQDVLISYGDSQVDENKKIDWKRKTAPISSGRGYLRAPIVIYDKSGNEKIISNDYRFALKRILMNPRCKVCKDKLNLNADIVLGDPWGMDGVDWDNGDSLIIVRTKLGSLLFKELLDNHLVNASYHQMSEVIKGQHIKARLVNVEKELKNQKYLRDYIKTESHTKEEIVNFARQFIANQIKRKQKEKSLLYRVFYRIIKKY